jgi:quercetin dioxygenase-like cupin family protein
LLVLILGSVVLVLHSRQAATPALPPVSLHAPLGQPEIAITTLVDATVPDLPAGSARVWVERWRFQPGPEAFTQQPLPEPHVIAVETGRLALLLNGQEQIINEGDQIIVPAKQSVELRNAGQTEAVAILVTFPSRQTITPRWNPLAITGEEAVPPFAFDLPGGPIHVRVERQVLPPGGALAPEVATEDVRFGAVDTGLLLTLEGTSLPVGWRAGKERVLLPQWAPPIAPGTVLTFRNGADVPVALYRVSLTPLRPA